MTADDNIELLLSEVDLLKAELQLHTPSPDDDWQLLQAIENTYHSNRLEGSTLSPAETEMVIRNGLTLSGKPMAENLLALNHYQAIQFIHNQAEEHTLLSEELLLRLHKILSQAIDRQYAGTFRTQAVSLDNGQPAIAPEQLTASLAEFIYWTRREGPFQHPVLFAAEAHLRLQTLRPFPSANGLCARLVMNFILLQEGYGLVNIASGDSERKAYFSALTHAQSGEIREQWQQFIAEQTLLSHQHWLKRLQIEENSDT